MENPKITVIIPTRERAVVLENALRTVTSQDYKNLEIIVSDNYSMDGTDKVVEQAKDSRIRYLNTGKRLSMSHNWEFALSHVQDGWVTFIGDDDGLLPRAISRIAEIIQQTKAQIIRTEYCTYDWPSIAGRPHGQLIVPLTLGYELRNSKQWLYKVLNGHSHYNQLPMIYNGGFIHISLLQKMKERVGCFFASVNPDVYTALALARLVDEFLYVREPLAISGTSKYSNGYSAFSTNTLHGKSAYQHFLSEGNIPFHLEVPTLEDGSIPLSLQACVYEAYLQAAPLGNGIMTITHEQQLPILLATSGKHRDSVDEWGKLFAEYHGLNFTQALKSANRLRPFLQARIFGRKLTRVASSVVTDRLHLQNVYDASVAAGVIRIMPSRNDSVSFLFKELVAKSN